jgi:CubicO group peptidase (beta-lactamase class C family)
VAAHELVRTVLDGARTGVDRVVRPNAVRRFPTEEVTSRRADAEVRPQDVGLAQADVDIIWRAVEQLYETRLYPALAFCLRRRGQILIDRAIGHASGNAPDDPPDAPLVAATPSSLFNLFSASKAITAMVVHWLDEEGLLHLDDAVVEYIPEFGLHGKEWITLRHVLTHRAGIPAVPAARGLDLLSVLHDPRRIARLLNDTRPAFPPGRRLAYHALTGGFVIAEVVERVTGRPIKEVLEQRILAPLGVAHLTYGVAEESVERVCRNALTGPVPPPPLSWLIKRALGVEYEQAIAYSNERRFLTGCVPAGNCIGTAEEACRFFDMLRQGGTFEGRRIFEGRTVRRAVAEQVYYELDLTLGIPVRYGLGFMLGSGPASVYGARTGAAFGHLGFTNVVVWADPQRELSACLMTSGKPFLSWGLRRWLQVMWTVSARLPMTGRRRPG